jgi:hypothetical protein
VFLHDGGQGQGRAVGLAVVVQQLGQLRGVTQAGAAEVDAGEADGVQPDPGPAATADLDVAGIAGVVADEDVLTWQRGEWTAPK